MKKSDKISSICFAIASISFYVAAIINFIQKDTSMGVVYLCLGSTNLCLFSVFMNKKDKEDKK